MPKYQVGDIININYYPDNGSGYYALITKMDDNYYYYNYIDTWHDDRWHIKIADNSSSVILWA